MNEFAAKQIIPAYPEIGDGLPIHAAAFVNTLGGPFSYDYDANGNMLTGWDFSDPANPKRRDFEYNADNMPTRIVHQSKGTTDYFYDGGGNRVKKVVNNGSTTYYVGNHYEVKDGAATKYIFAGNIRLAMVDSTGIYYYHKDHLGSTAAMTKANNSAIQIGSKADYLPFGGERTLDSVTLTSYAFTDQERDSESGLYNYGARLYDPVIGQFITPDSIVSNPLDPQTFNRYSYCRNNPLIYVDPSGHNPFLIGALVGALISGAQSDWNPEAMMLGAVTGIVSAGAFDIAGGFIADAGITNVVAQAGIHAFAGGIAGGINSAIVGGDIGEGMLYGAASAGVGKFVGETLNLKFVGRTVAGGVTAGIIAEVRGGSFGDAFGYSVASAGLMAGFGYAFNDKGDHIFYKFLKKVFRIDLAKAEEIAYQELGQHTGHNDLDDAMRHANWNKRMVEETNWMTSVVAGHGHEIEGFFNRPSDMSAWQYFLESRMDLHNNLEGRWAAFLNRPINPDTLVKDVGEYKFPY